MSENSPTKVVWTSPRKVFQDLSPARNIVNNEIVFDKEELKNSSEFHTAENTPIKQCTIENIEYVHRRSFNKSSSESPKLNESKSDCSVYDSPKSVKAADQMDHIIRLFKKFNVHSPVNSKEGTSNNESTTQNRLFEQIDENSTANSNFYDALDVRELEQTSNQTIPTNNHFKDSLENLSIHIDPESNFDSLKSSISKENDTEFYESTSLETDSLNKNTLPSFEEVFKIPEKIHQVPTTFLNKYSDIETVNPSNIRASIQSVDSTFSLDSLNNENEENSKRTSRNFHEQLPELNFDNDLDNYLTPISSTELSPNPTKSNSNPSILSELINDQDMEEFLINERKIENIMLQNPEINSKFVLKDKSPENLEQITHKITNKRQSLRESIHEKSINETFDSKTNLIEQIEFENLQFEDRWENQKSSSNSPFSIIKSTIPNEKVEQSNENGFEKDLEVSNASIETVQINIPNVSEKDIPHSTENTFVSCTDFAETVDVKNETIKNVSKNINSIENSFESCVETVENNIIENEGINNETFQNIGQMKSTENTFVEDVNVSNSSLELSTIIDKKDSSPNKMEFNQEKSTVKIQIENESIPQSEIQSNQQEILSTSIKDGVDPIDNKIKKENLEMMVSPENVCNENVPNKTIVEENLSCSFKDSLVLTEQIRPILNTDQDCSDGINISNESFKDNSGFLVDGEVIKNKSTEIFEETTPVDKTASRFEKENIEITKSIETVCTEGLNYTSNENLIMNLNAETSMPSFSNKAEKTNEDTGNAKSIEFNESFNETPNENLITADKTNLDLSYEESLAPKESDIELKASESVYIEGLDSKYNGISEENLTTAVNITLDLNIESQFSNENISKENIEIPKSNDILYSESLNNTSNEVSEENLTITDNKTLNLNSETSEKSFTNEKSIEIISKENVEAMKPTEIMVIEEFNNTSNEMSEENLTIAVNKTTELSFESSLAQFSNETVIKEDIEMMNPTEIVCSENPNNISNEISEENLTMEINKTMELSSATSTTPFSNETTTKEDIEIINPTEIDPTESPNNVSNEMFEENLTMEINKTLELSSTASITPFSNETTTKEEVEIMNPTGIVCSENPNNVSNEISEENLTMEINKTMELSSLTYTTPLSNETVTKEDIEMMNSTEIDSRENSNNKSNEMSEENLTMEINKTLELNSEETLVIPVANEQIMKGCVVEIMKPTENVSNEDLSNASNEMAEENLTTVFNKTMELSSETFVTPCINENITKENVGIVSTEGLIKTSNEMVEEILTTAINKTIELSSETSVTPLTNEKIPTESIEILSNEGLTNTLNEMAEENVTSVFNKIMELSSETSVTPFTNEKITKKNLEIVSNEGLTNTLNEVSEENLTTVFNKTMELSSETSVTPFTNKKITKESEEIVPIEGLIKTSNEMVEEILITAINKTMELSSETSVTPFTNEKITKESVEIVSNEDLTKTSNEMTEEILNTVFNKTMELSSETSVTPCTNEKITKESEEIVPIDDLTTTSNEVAKENLTTVLNKTMELSSETSVTPFTNEPTTKENVEIFSTEFLTKTSNEVAEEILTTIFNKTMDLSSETSAIPCTNEKITKESEEIDPIEGLTNTSNEVAKENLTTVLNKTMELSPETTVTPFTNEKITKESVEVVSTEGVIKKSNEMIEEILTTAINKTMELSTETSPTPLTNEKITKESVEIVCNENLTKTSNEVAEENLTTVFNKTMELSSEMKSINEKSIPKNVEIMKPTEIASIEVLDRFCDVSETNLSTTPNKTLDINSMKNQLPINLKSEIQENLEFTKNVNNDELIQSSKILMEKSLKEKDDKIAESTPLTPKVEHKSLNADMAATKSNEKSEINILNDISKSGIIIEPELKKIALKVSDFDISKSSISIENTKDGILESKIYSPAWNTELPISITENKTDNIIKFSMNWEAPTKPSNLLDDQKAHSDNLRVVNEDGLNVSSCSSELSKTLVDDETCKTASNPNTVQGKVETNKLIDLESLKQNTNQNQIDKLRTAADNIDSPQNFYSGHTSLKTTNVNPSQDSPSYCFDVFESSVTKLNLAEVHGNSVKKNKKTEMKIRTEDINVDTCLNILAPIKTNEDNFNNIDDLSIINKKSIIEPILHEDSTNNKLSIESIPIEQIVTNLQSNGNNSRNVVDIQTKQHGSNIDELLSIRNQLESDQTNVQQSLTNTPPPPTASCSNTSSEEVFVSPRGFSWGALFGKSSNEGTFREPRPSTIKLFDPLLNNSPSPTSKMNINPNNDSSQLTNTNNSQTTNIEAILNENITEPSTCNVETQQAQIQEQHSPNVEDNFEKINIEKSTLIEPIFSSSPKTNQSTSLIKIESDEKRKELLELKRHLQLQNKLAETNQYQHLAKLTKQTQEIVLLIKYRYGHANDQLKNIIHETEERTHKKQKDLNKLEFQLQSELDKNKHLKEETIIARNHLTKCEDALNDVYEKYQAMRERIIRYEQSEKEMLKMIDDQVIKGDELNVNYLALKKQGIEDLTKLNGIYLKAKHDHETEFLALQGRIRRQQLLSESLESELKRKTEECQRLSEMCDEILIKKK
ncbi:protein PF14_0175-like [Chrysoperla carnea]|uniref:protein PF14_0175-like n=1 Tax=Chrysoperla carnea TaxID=189513 RepID=UPI001D08414E|nr:protein PF14_0175-like [Chrysoperla carnea]